MKEIARLMGKINDTTISETKIKDLNDQINNLLRLKTIWAQRIVELGSRVPLEKGQKLEDELRTDKTYRYFGLAKFLPGVRDIQAAREQTLLHGQPTQKKQGRGEIYKSLETSYFQFSDSADSELEDNFEKEFCPLYQPNYDPALMFPFPQGIPTQPQVAGHLLEIRKSLLVKKYAL